MNRQEKTTSVTELRDRFERATVAVVAVPRGLSVAQATRLRRGLRAAGGEYKVAKNTLARRALKDTAYQRLEALLDGPSGLVFGYHDPIAVTKALVRFVEELGEALLIKGGALEGQRMAPEQVKALATMPSVEQLRARVVAMAMAPGARVVAAVMSPGARIAAAIEALVKRKQHEDGAAAPLAEAQ